MRTIGRSCSLTILATAVFSSMASVPTNAQAALPAPPLVTLEQATRTTAVVDKTDENKLALMLFVHRTGLPVAAAMPGVER